MAPFSDWVVGKTMTELKTAETIGIPMTHSPARGKKALLTKKQIEILRLVNEGMANAEIAKALCITEGTTKWHLHRIYGRLGVRSRTAAAANARKLGIL